MKIKFKYIRLQNFRSYGNEIHFDFNDKGFHLIFGVNGAGKSTLFRALIWCLNGVDSEGIKGTDLKSWGFKGSTFVEIGFSYDGKKYKLFRQQSPNKLRLNDEDVSQEDVEDIFPFNMKLFNYITFMSQFAGQFIDAKPAEKLELFTRILELEKWDGYSKKASDKVHELNNELTSLQGESERLEGKKEALKDQNYDQEVLIFDRDRKLKKSQIKQEIGSIERNITKNEKELETLQDDYTKLVEYYESIELDEKSLERLTNEIYELETQNEGIKTDAIKLKTRIESQEENIKKLETTLKRKTEDYLKKKNTTCNSCNQIITEEHAKTQIAELNDDITKQIEDIVDKIEEAQELIEQYRNKYKSNENKIIKLKKEKTDLDEKVEEMMEMENKISRKMTVIESISSTIKSLERDKKKQEFDIQQLEKQKNPYIEKQEKLKKDIVEIDEDLLSKKDLILSTTKLKDNYEYWIKAFKEIKLFITENSMDEFNIFCNDNLMKLGLPKWEINNKIKDGKIKKFITLIKSPKNEKEVNIDCFSGGEKQRLKLAMIFGLIEFFSNKVSTNIEVFDEPTQWCDNSGISDLLYILKDKSEEKGIYLIDHRVLSEGRFDKTYQVKRSEDESSYIE